MAMLSSCTSAPCSAQASTSQRRLSHGAVCNVVVCTPACRQPASAIHRRASAPQHQSSLHTQIKHVAVAQRSFRTRAAAQETISLDKPVLEFLGVNNGMQTVRGVMHVAADSDLVYSILTDYDNCARVFRNVVTSETMFTADGDKQVLQACQWQVIGLKGTFNVHLDVEENPAAKMLVFRLKESSFMRDFEGRWQVEPASGGGCRIEHILAVKPVMDIPPAIAPYTSSIFKQQVGKLLQDLERAISREAAAVTASN